MRFRIHSPAFKKIKQKCIILQTKNLETWFQSRNTGRYRCKFYISLVGGVVYTCGENSYHQLGHQPPPPRLLAPAPVGGGGGRGAPAVKAVGVAAGRYHSVYWSEESLFTWGLNAGQLGHLKVLIDFLSVADPDRNCIRFQDLCRYGSVFQLRIWIHTGKYRIN